MLKGAVLPLLLRMASPNAIAFLVQAGVSMVEVWYIGHLGTISLAAIALMFPGLMLMQMLSGGAIGGAVLKEAMVYGTVLFAGCVLIWLASLLSAVFRGMGDMRFPASLMVFGAMLQVPLAGTLILGWFGFPKMGISGAATATILVAGVNTIILLMRLTFSRIEVPLRRARLQLQWLLVTDILRVGALASLSPIFSVMTITLVNGLISGLGPSAIAGYGIGARLEFLLIPMVFGLGASMTSLVGMNMGAGNIVRAERIGWIGGGCAALLTGIVGMVLALFPGLWINLFTNEATVFSSGASYLKIVGPAFLFQGLGLSLYFASQGARAVFWPVIATMVRFGIAGAGAMLGVQWFGFGGNFIFGCIAAGMVAYGIITASSLGLGAWRSGKRK